MGQDDRADLVVIGAGTIGGWASVFAAEDGRKVVTLERGLVGQGASSRAAGIVRAQGGTPATVALGRWSIDFYRGQHARYGIDSGFRELGYLILAVTDDDERAGRERVAMQHAEGLDVRWVDASRGPPANPDDGRRGSSRRQLPRRRRRHRPAAQRARPTAPRCVSSAWTCASAPRRRASGSNGPPTAGAASPASRRATARSRPIASCSPAARPSAPSGELAGLRIPAGAVRHTGRRQRAPCGIRRERQPMVFDIGARPVLAARGGRAAVGMSNADEPPGRWPARSTGRRRRMRGRLARFVPGARGPRLRRVWAATIDFTPDHLPILGPGDGADGAAGSRACRSPPRAATG